ncbi:hypothetical protein K493DRAFT_299519 [Basidiobolus meristosporus CBS 931.73]|uniref:Uncharacterized protein n=1 Tax=Basidiobolus meristosporus CBS 931.73 TaxID=1314790 RepID=A0A1Y1YMD5_9FUNG|nr:hypothetical protein K493DRAFT_299519 [Basidiobolus meristosporus CBS 931.73]|eukprot:ORX99179.1 hypothetical protein K493DRAFT_299519 [Basidiobolus meristosporus CBS 931.73]
MFYKLLALLVISSIVAATVLQENILDAHDQKRFPQHRKGVVVQTMNGESAAQEKLHDVRPVLHHGLQAAENYFKHPEKDDDRLLSKSKVVRERSKATTRRTQDTLE